MGVNELSTRLWHDRELLDLLIFKLEEEQMLLTAGKTKWLQYATREVQSVLQRLREAGLVRAVEVSRVAQEWGTGEEASLSELAAAAPEGPWGEILRSHREAMSSSTAHIRQLRDVNEQFLRAAARSTQETVAALQPGAGVYDSHGSTGPAAGSHLFDTRMNTVVTRHSELGGRDTQLQRTQEVNMQQQGALEARRSGNEDIDLGTAILELQLQQTSYQAALAVTTKVLPPTLMDLLR